MDNKLEQEARRLFEINAQGWRNAISWDELHEDTRQIWRDSAQKRTTTPRDRPLTLAEKLSVLKARHWEIFSPAERRELLDAILFLTVTGAAQSEILPTAHTDHPLRHFDRTCPACLEEHPAVAAPSATELSRKILPQVTIGQAIEDESNACTFRHVCRLMKRKLEAAQSATQPTAAQELRNIIEAKRFDRDTFASDTEFADWALSRCRFALAAVGGKSE